MFLANKLKEIAEKAHLIKEQERHTQILKFFEQNLVKLEPYITEAAENGEFQKFFSVEDLCKYCDSHQLCENKVALCNQEFSHAVARYFDDRGFRIHLNTDHTENENILGITICWK